MDFVDVEDFVPGVVVDLRYATPDNPFGRAFYPSPRALLRRGTAEKLKKAAEILAARSLRLKVWDAYRPLSVQRALWEAVPVPYFVAPPERGSRHNRGAAVDVTLISTDGSDVPMPTDFDDFSDRAHADSPLPSDGERANRALLRAAMLDAGFAAITSEWWHFNDPEFERYPLCDVIAERLLPDGSDH
jgi:D-alanyl-D-alanine dipeptidase